MVLRVLDDPTMTLAHLVVAIATSVYILLAIQFEEHDMVREFGDAYEEYRSRGPMLIPFSRARRTAAPARPHATGRARLDTYADYGFP